MTVTVRLDQPRLVVPPRPGVRVRVYPGPVLIVCALLLAPLFLSKYWIFNAATGLTLGISCLGLLVLAGWSRQVSLMHAGVTGSATYIGAFVSRVLQERNRYGEDWRGELRWLSAAWPSVWGFLAAVGFGVVAYLAVGFVARRLAGVYLVVLTFAAQFAIENTIFVKERFTNWQQYVERPQPFGISVESDRRYYWFVALVLLALVLALHRLRSSRHGRAIVMAGHEPEVAAAAGVSPWRYRVLACAIAGFCAGVAGALEGPMYREPPGYLQYDAFHSLYYLAVAVAAGGASLLAVVGVALAMQLIPQIFLSWQLNVYLLGGIGMAVGLLLGPRGLGGVVIDLFAGRLRRRPSPPDAFGSEPVVYDSVELPGVIVEARSEDPTR